MITDTRAFLPESIDRARFADPSWAEDGAGFFYTRLRPDVAVKSAERYKPHQSSIIIRVDQDEYHFRILTCHRAASRVSSTMGPGGRSRWLRSLWRFG